MILETFANDFDLHVDGSLHARDYSGITATQIRKMLATMETEAIDNEFGPFDANLLNNAEEAYNFMKIFIHNGFDSFLKEGYDWFITNVARKIMFYMREADDQ